MRKNFVWQRSYTEALKGFPDNERLAMYELIQAYGLADNEDPDDLENLIKSLTGYQRSIFVLIKPVLDKSKARWENGIKGGRPSKQEEDIQEETTQTETKPKPNSNQTETKPKPNSNQTETKPKANTSYSYDYHKERKGDGKEKGKERVADAQNLSVKIFAENFPKIIIDRDIPATVDVKLLVQKMKESNWLSNIVPEPLSWYIKNYKKIIADTYKNYSTNNFNEQVNKLVNEITATFGQLGSYAHKFEQLSPQAQRLAEDAQQLSDWGVMSADTFDRNILPRLQAKAKKIMQQNE